MRMRVLVLALLLLLLLISARSKCVPGCHVTNISFTVESEECGSSITINTNACAGQCFTEDCNYCSLMEQNSQTSCNIKDLKYESYKFKGCPAGVDSDFVYPVALSCECGKCKTDITDCEVLSQQSTTCSAH